MERKPEKRASRSIVSMVFLLFAAGFYISSNAAQAASPRPQWTEQEIATEKFLSAVENALARKFFDVRHRPVIRVAVIDFTDEAANAVKAGRELAEKLTQRLYPRPQFDVVSREAVERFLRWTGRTTLSAMDAQELFRLQHRINTMDPDNGVHVLLTGEVRRGTGRNLRISAFLVNFHSKIGAYELEQNIVDTLPISGEIPLPTEQAMQDATEILVKSDNRSQEEGRLIILANTRGNALATTEYAAELTRENPFPWMKIPAVLTRAKQEVHKPEEVRIGLGRLSLSPLAGKSAGKRLEYPLLNGKFATDAVYFDEILPAQKYRVTTSFLDVKTNQSFAESLDAHVEPGTTTVIVVSIYVPAEKERIRSKQPPRIQTFEFFWKGTEITPGG